MVNNIVVHLCTLSLVGGNLIVLSFVSLARSRPDMRYQGYCRLCQYLVALVHAQLSGLMPSPSDRGQGRHCPCSHVPSQGRHNLATLLTA